jgi:hypothetical protein
MFIENRPVIPSVTMTDGQLPYTFKISKIWSMAVQGIVF